MVCRVTVQTRETRSLSSEVGRWVGYRASSHWLPASLSGFQSLISSSGPSCIGSGQHHMWPPALLALSESLWSPPPTPIH